MLVTFDELKSLYGMPTLKDANKVQFENLLTTAEEEVLSYAGLTLGGTITEAFDGCKKYVLTYQPVKEIKEVIGVESYSYNKRTNVISVSSEDEITVTYTLGYEDSKCPSVIKQAIAITVQYWAKFLNSNLVGVQSRSTDIGNETVEQYELPLVVKSSLDRFRRSIY